MFVHATNRMNNGFHNATAHRELLSKLRWRIVDNLLSADQRSRKKHIGLLRHWRIAQLNE